jgi:hypothetical protein
VTSDETRPVPTPRYVSLRAPKVPTQKPEVLKKLFVIFWLVDLAVFGSIPGGGTNQINMCLSHVGSVCSRARSAQTVAGLELFGGGAHECTVPRVKRVLGLCCVLHLPIKFDR